MKLLGVALGIILVVVLGSGLCEQHSLDPKNGATVKAWYLTLPGYNTIYYAECSVELKDWVGTQYGSLRGVNEDGSHNPEVTAGLALKMLGLYAGYELRQKEDGHWILYRPARQERYFSWNSRYRITPFKLADK